MFRLWCINYSFPFLLFRQFSFPSHLLFTSFVAKNHFRSKEKENCKVAYKDISRLCFIKVLYLLKTLAVKLCPGMTYKQWMLTL
jgi:hypothetical protein